MKVHCRPLRTGEKVSGSSFGMVLCGRLRDVMLGDLSAVGLRLLPVCVEMGIRGWWDGADPQESG